MNCGVNINKVTANAGVSAKINVLSSAELYAISTSK